MRRRDLLGAALAAALVVPCFAVAEDATSAVSIDGGPYVPTPQVVVDRMLELAKVRHDDVVYDLGSGDGRLVITAARRYGARGVGVEREGRLVALARFAAEEARVQDLASFTQGDLFEADLRKATVVTLYLLPHLLEKLLPKLSAELAPGARIVAHDYSLYPWAADQAVEFDVPEKEELVLSPRTNLYLYVIR
jgi:SAM-dependent methyltransferase